MRGDPHILIVGDPGLGKSQVCYKCTYQAKCDHPTTSDHHLLKHYFFLNCMTKETEPLKGCFLLKSIPKFFKESNSKHNWLSWQLKRKTCWGFLCNFNI